MTAHPGLEYRCFRSIRELTFRLAADRSRDASSLAIRRASGRDGKSFFHFHSRRDSRAGKYRARERERVFTKAGEIAACPVTPLAYRI